ncbi:MAG: hypothetical protein HQK49_12085 [Oligoflexia bacterium]|nr:hypothetical protein [Oligoflexia bacterium]
MYSLFNQIIFLCLLLVVTLNCVLANESKNENESVAKTDFKFKLVPSSRHHQITTSGLFIDQHSSVVVLDSRRAFAAIAAAIPLFEIENSKLTPQLILFGSSAATFRFSGSFSTLFTETVDARVGLSYDLFFSAKSRLAFSWTHQSGHTSDNLTDLKLFGPNVGYEIIALRYVFDVEDRLRVGGGPRVYAGSDPYMKPLAGELFLEYYPIGASLSAHQFSPMVAVGIEEYGNLHYDTSIHIQLAISNKNPFKSIHYPALGLVVGGYKGQDISLKHYSYRHRHIEFLYAGLNAEI